METKLAKTFEECCDEVAKKKCYSNWDEVYCNLSSADFYEVEKEAAELYNKETAAERDSLKEEVVLLNDSMIRISDHRDSLKEENNRLREDIKTLGEVGYFSIDKLKEENERLKEDRERRIAKELNLEEEVKGLIEKCDSLKQLNSELVEGIKELSGARSQYHFFMDGYKNGSASISEATKAAEEENAVFESLISKANQQKEKP